MNIIEVSQVVKKYQNIQAVAGISLSIRQGEIYGLLGPNGAGKSTMIGMIATLLKPTAGEIFIKGHNIIEKPDLVKNYLGLVPQDIALYPTLTAYENLEFWGKMYGMKGKILDQKIQYLLDVVGLKNRAKDRVETYSGGMKRRINIAVGLLHEPEILIMDEPTVGVDPQSRNHILETVKALNEKGITVIYTSHYMEEVEFLCNRIGIMDGGKLIAEGSKEELTKLVGDYHTVKIRARSLGQSLLSDINNIQGVYDTAFYDDQVDILTADGEALLPELVSILVAKGIKMESIQVIEPNLESVFLHLTGRALRD